MKKLLLSFALFTTLFTASKAQQQLVISEIMYSAALLGGGNPGGNTLDSLQFIELFNSGTTDVNLKDYTFRTALQDTLPNFVLKAGAYYINAVNAAHFKSKFGVNPEHQWSKGTLSGQNNQIKRIDLYDGAGVLVDSVRYRTNQGWPTVPTATGGGGGVVLPARTSIVFCDPTMDNGIGTNWYLSSTTSTGIANGKAIMASPGKADCSFVEVTAKTQTLTTYKGINLVIPAANLSTPTGTTITITKQPTNGTLNRQGQNFTYVPKAGFCGTDAFEFKANINVNFDNGKVTINVLCNLPYVKSGIGIVTKDNDANFIPDSLGKFTEIEGIVHSPNFATSPATTFCVIDAKNKLDGVFINKAATDFGYTPKEGDKVRIQGRVAQTTGLTTINPDTIFVIGTGTVFTPTNVETLDEDTEASLVTLKGLTLVTPAQWGTAVGGGGGGGGGNAPVGYQLDVTDGINKYVIFVDKDIEDLFFNVGPKKAKFDMTGIGAQVAQNAGGGGGGGATLNNGYRLMPRKLSDMKIYVETNDVVLGTKLNVYPNPFANEINVTLGEKMDALKVANLLGQNIFTAVQLSDNQTINTENWESGVYFITVEKDNKQFTTKIVK
jgi:hypothetical protein